MSLDVSNTLHIGWAATTGAVSYQYQILNSADAVVRSGTVSTNALNYTFAQAQADGTDTGAITVQLKAVDSVGNVSPAWADIEISTPFDVSQAASPGDVSGITLTTLGAGDSATKNVGTAAGTVAAGDHTHTSAVITDGATGSFTTADSKTVTVTNGIITAIV